MVWNTESIKQALSSVPGIVLETETPGEDFTTNGLTYQVQGCTDRLYVRGFVTGDNPLGSPDNVNVEMVELTTGYSDGGESHQPANVIARALMTVALTQMGHSVVRSLDPYF